MWDYSMEMKQSAALKAQTETENKQIVNPNPTLHPTTKLES